MAASYRNKTLIMFCIMMISHYSEEVQTDRAELPKICKSGKTPAIKINTGRLSIINHHKKDIVLYTQSENCYKCNLVATNMIKELGNCTLLVDSRWPTRIDIQFDNNTSLQNSDSSCSFTKLFLEQGQYVLHVNLDNDDANLICNGPILENDPMDSNIPIYVALAIGLVVSLIWILLKFLYRKGILHRVFFFWSTEGIMVLVFKGGHVQDLGTPTNINASEVPVGESPSRKERLRSLDTFRGLSLVVMNFVNYGGGRYWFFAHSKWNGITVADLVFPWFVFIMGTSMVFSFNSQLKRNMTKKRMFLKILKRSIILFLLGLMLNSGGGVELTKLRIPGVLQRFGVTYLIVATIHLFFARTADEHQYRWWSPVRDILDYWLEWVIHIILLIVWFGLTFGLEVPDCPKGYLGPGGLADEGQYPNCTGGAAGYIDRLVFGIEHIYQHSTPQEIYHNILPNEPEGLLGTLTSCFMCFLGVQAGKILFVYKDWVLRVRRFIAWAVVLGIIGAILTKGSKNEGWIPACKNLWSISFVIILSSFAFILLMMCYLLVDVWKIWSGAPFYYPGMNPIVLYVGHELLIKTFPFYIHVNKTHTQQLVLSIWGTFLWFLVALYMDYKYMYITV